MTLGDIIKEYRTSHGLSQDIIAERSGLSKAYISILERNRNPKTGEPPIATPKTINAIALAINSDFDTIFSKLDSNLKISIGEQLPQASIPRPLPPNITALPTMKEWPVLGATACGKPLHRKLLEETVMAPADIKADVVFRCVGHSMINARIFDGDAVFIHLQPEVENGQIAVVRIGDEYTLKRVYVYGDCVELRAENPTVRTITVRGAELDPDNFEIVGLAVAFFSTVFLSLSPIRRRIRIWHEKTAPHRAALDNFISGGYTKHRKGAAGRRLTRRYYLEK